MPVIDDRMPRLVRAARSAARRLASAVSKRAPLSTEQLDLWDRNGYLVLKGFFPPREVAAVNAEVDRLWATRAQTGESIVIDVHNAAPHRRRIYFRDAPEDAKNSPYKLNDLYLVSDVVRETVLHPRLVPILHQLLDGEPMVCNSLNLEYGSQQDFHFDTWYMPPPLENRLVVSFIALEDITADAGPLKYYPGSHLIPPYRFSHGGLHAVDEEVPACLNYVRGQLAEAGLREERFTCKAGDVFLWHAQLFHGGSPIDDLSRTRRSLVTHYWRAMDWNPDEVATIGPGRHYYQRPPQPVPQGQEG